MASVRRPLIGVMGAGEGAAPAELQLAEALGRAIAERGWGLLSGGRPCGVMAAASRGASTVEGHLVVGVLPGDGIGGVQPRGSTAALDVALFTGLGQARNVINVLSSDVVVVCGAGGAGTASEAAHAIKAGRPLLLLAVPPAWEALFSSLGGDVEVCNSIRAVISAIDARLSASERPAAAWPVALVQLQPGADPATNRRTAEAWLERALDPPAGSRRPTLLMLPEIWNAPYAAEHFGAHAEPIPEPGSLLADGPSPSLAVVARLARRHGVSVIAGSIPERGADGRIYNTATVINGEGRLLARHRKLHLFDVDVPGGIRFRESDSLSAGDQLTVLSGDGDPLATGLEQPPNLGLLICYDIRFPELALLMQQQLGCSVIACPAAFNTTTGPRHWHLVMRARAVDTQCFVLACSSARPTSGDGYPSYGHSLVVDPWGTVLAEAGPGEQILQAELDLTQVSLARQAIPTGEQRRHDLYRLSPA